MSALFLSLILSLPAVAELPMLPLAAATCETTLSQDDVLSASTSDLMRVISFGLEQKILSPRDLGRHYLAGTRGRKLKMFISYVTKQLADDATVKAVGRSPSPAEVRYRADLARVRTDALALGERHPEWFRQLTTEWRVTVRKLALQALGRNPEGRDGLGYAIEGKPQPPSLSLKTWHRHSAGADAAE